MADIKTAEAKKDLSTTPVVKEFDPLHTFKTNDFGSREAEVPPHLRADGKASGPFDDVLGVAQMLPGESGWASLDAAGMITGVYPFPPEVDSGIKACRVRKSGALGDGYHTLLSEAGAELQPPLNANPDIRFVSSPPEALEASANKFRESREHGVKRNVGSDGTPGQDFGSSPQLAGAYEDRDTHSKNRGQVEGSTLDARSEEERKKAAAEKAAQTKK